MARLDDARVDRAHRDLVDALAADLLEREGLPVVGEVARGRILAQREVVRRPERVADQRTRIRVPDGPDPQDVEELPLEAGGRVVERGQGRDLRTVGGDRERRVEEPVLPGVREEVVHLEPPGILSPVGADHEHELGAAAHAQPPRQPGDDAGLHAAPELADPVAVEAGDARRKLLRQARRDELEARHGPAISAICRSRLMTGAGTTSPRTASAPRHAASGASDQAPRSPLSTPAVGGP